MYICLYKQIHKQKVVYDKKGGGEEVILVQGLEARTPIYRRRGDDDVELGRMA